MTGPRRAVLGLGSNLGDRAFHLRAAVAALVDEVVAVSGVWETEPVGGPEQGPYLNLVVVLRTTRSAHELLDVARRLESAAQRVRSERWGPRTLDVDVLWVDGETVDDHELTVPHPRMFERDFVLAPLDEVAGDLIPGSWAGPAADVRRLGAIDGRLPAPPEGAPGPAGEIERRRQVLETALDIHPDLYLDQLVAALAAAGLGAVEEDELVADLGALGFDVDPDEDVDLPPPAAPSPPAPAPEPREAVAAAAPTRDADEQGLGPRPVTDAFADDLSSPDRGPGRAADREPRTVGGIDRTVIVAAVVALVVVAVAFALAALGGDDDTVAGGGDTVAVDSGEGPTDGTTDGTTDGSAPVETSPVAPIGPGADPELADGGDASLSFDGADGDVLPALGEWEWDVVHGTATVVDGRVVATPAEDDPDGVLAVVDAGARDLRFEVALPEDTVGAGIAFGVEDDGSYLLWAPAPGFPTIALFQVRDGSYEFLLNGGVVQVEPGTRVGVHIDGADVELLVGGAVVATHTDASEGARVGIGLLPESPLAVFDDVVFASP